MSDSLSADDRRRRYFEEYKDRVDRYREGHHFFEQRTIEFATSAMKGLTYLNGGGLVAIPTVVALFRADPGQAKIRLICSAAAFIAGLVLVALSQAFAFFVMARRSEAETLHQYEEMELLAAIHFPGQPADQKARVDRATDYRNNAVTKISKSNTPRAIALVCIWLSLFLFVIGCLLGGWAVLGSQ